MKEKPAMDKIQTIEAEGTGNSQEPVREKYVPPRIVTYTSDQILEQVGPALACTGASPACPATG
jgi:hypothetical protein